MWRNDSGQLSDWVGQANGGFANNLANTGQNVPLDWNVVGTGDFNGDGRVDVLWRNNDGTITDWLGQANGGFVNNDAAARQPLNNVLQIAGVGDFNGDHKADMLLRTSEGSLQTWVGSASGAILSPTEKVWADSIQAARDLMNEMMIKTMQANIEAEQMAAHSGGGPTPPTSNLSGEFAAAIGDMWYLDHPSMWGNNTGPRAPTIIEVWSVDTDPNFQLVFAEGNSFGLNYLGSVDSVTLVDSSTGTYNLNINGIDLVANWHDGAPPVASSPSSPISPDAIIVSGVKPSSPGSGIFVPSGYMEITVVGSLGVYFGDGFGGMGAPKPPYETPGVSAQANAFADAHVRNAGATEADKHAYQLVHDQLARLYDFASMNPTELIDVGHGLWKSAASAVAELGHVQVGITDLSPQLNHGAWTQASPDYKSATITLNPQNTDPQGFGYWLSLGDPGETWAIFHELGHALNDLSRTPGDVGTEATANSAARSMMNLLGLPIPSSTAGLPFDD